MLIKGKQIAPSPDGIGTAQINDGSVTAGKCDSSIVVCSGANPMTGILQMGGNNIRGVGTPTDPSDAVTKAYADSLSGGLSFKDSCSALATSNITPLSGLTTTIDGVILSVDGMRACLQNQTNPVENGIWVVHAGAWTRPTDFATGSHASGALVLIAGGTVHANQQWICSTAAPLDVVGTNQLAFVQFAGPTPVPRPQPANNNMAAQQTTADGQLACATTVAQANANGGRMTVLVNGAAQRVGNGVKTTDCYFSGDSGATARSYAAIAAGDQLYWNGSVAGFQLATTDTLDFLYSALP